MSRRTDQLNRIEATVTRMEEAMARVERVLDLDMPGGLSVLASDARDAKTAAESAFVGMQTLASQATAKPGADELGRAIGQQVAAGLSSQLKAVDTAIRELGQAVAAEMPAAPQASPAGSAGTARGKGGTP